MLDDGDLLSRVKPLADPLRIIALVAVANAAFIVVIYLAIGHLWNGLAMACALLLLALLAAPSGRTNAIYLRAFRSDKSTAKLRGEIAAILGPEFRLSGIRPPRETPRAGW